MCPCEFASAGGGVFIALAILGLLNVLGPTPTESILGNWWWLDTTEIIFSAILGGILLVASRARPSVERPVVMFTGWFLLVLAGFGLFRDEIFFMQFERPLQIIFYFFMGIWALLAGLCKDAEEIEADKPTSVY